MSPKVPDEPEDELAEGRAVSVEELDFTDDEHVRVLDQNRYVVSPDAPLEDQPAPGNEPDPTAPGGAAEPESERAAEEASTGEPTRQGGADRGTAGRAADGPEPAQNPHEQLQAGLDESPHDYGIELTAKLEGRTGTHRTRSDDLVHTFESLLLWLTHYLDDQTPPAEVLGILLAESTLTVRYPKGTLREVVEAHGLTPQDSIADLLEAVDDDDGVTFSGR